METPKKNKGFFCVAYLVRATEQRQNNDGTFRTVITQAKTVYYHQVVVPAKLAQSIKDWHWIKIYHQKEDYFAGADYAYIFDKENPPRFFSYKNLTR